MNVWYFMYRAAEKENRDKMPRLWVLTSFESSKHAIDTDSKICLKYLVLMSVINGGDEEKNPRKKRELRINASEWKYI